MRLPIVCKGRAGSTLALVALLALFLSACATTATVAPGPAAASTLAEDDDLSELIAQMSTDLHRSSSRQASRNPAAPPATASAAARKQKDLDFAARAKAIFGRLENGTASLQMPVVGVQPVNLTNSWGNSRDGGRRKHRGIDIFAPKGTAVVAVAEGVVSFIGEQPKGGRCIWLSTETGRSYYYAHLDRWATGLYEGLEVHPGDILGYVGNTGNAKYTPSHLHFAVRVDDQTVNPYPILTTAVPVRHARMITDAPGAQGTR